MERNALRRLIVIGVGEGVTKFVGLLHLSRHKAAAEILYHPFE